jgi:two-component system sensor histidine kinase PilS (NtrC family)
LQNFLIAYRAALTQDSEIDLRLPDESLEILFDPEHLHRVLSNLLDNALRHSHTATGRATAQIRVTWEHLSRRCLIEIVDDGLGVAESEQAKLFEPFYTTVEGGTGLGLYLCKELCEINHATLVYRPTTQDQSCFRIAILQRS